VADSYTGVFSHIQTFAKTTLAADAWLQTGSGFRVEVKTFEDEPRDTEFDYAQHELPAIAFDCFGGGEDEDIATSGLVEARHSLTVWVVTEAGTQGQRLTLCKDIVARVITVLAAQYGDNQMSDLDAEIPGADLGSIFVRLQDATTEQTGGDDDEEPYRAVGILSFDVGANITR
jgi:hypothetical protein